MSRAIGETTIQDNDGNVIIGASIDLLNPATSLRLTVPVYADATSASVLTLPFICATGQVVFYLAAGQLVTVQATFGSVTATETIAVIDPTQSGSSGPAAPIGPAGGDLIGNYPNPTLRPTSATGGALGTDVLNTSATPQIKVGTFQAPIILPSGVRVWDGTGAPSNANGANGDVYIRSDGAATSTFYQKVTGAWIVLTLPVGGTAGGALTGSFPNPALAAGIATGAALGADVLVTGAAAQVKTGTLKAPIILPNGLRIWDGTGIPSNAIGANGDLYIRSDGAALTTLYQRVVNLWTSFGGAPTGSAGGALTGTYPNPTLAAGTATGAVLGTDVELVARKAAASGYASLNASSLVPVAQLGTGTADATKVLAGNSTWVTSTTGPQGPAGTPGAAGLPGTSGVGLNARQPLWPTSLVGMGSIDATRIGEYNVPLMASQYAAGVRGRLLELQWSTIQPVVNAALSVSVVAQYQAIIDAFVATGTDTVIILDLGLQYPLASVEAVDPLTDQYNVQWRNIRGSLSPCINIFWSTTVQGYVTDYLSRLFDPTLGLNFHKRLWAVRTGVNTAEWNYPVHTNSNIVGNTTALAGSGTVQTYTVANSLVAGNPVSVTGAVPAGYNGSRMIVASATATAFTVAGTATGAQTTASTVNILQPASLWAYDTTAQAYFSAQGVGSLAPPRSTKTGLSTFGSAAQAAFFFGMLVDADTNAINWLHDALRPYTNAWICPLLPGGSMWQGLVYGTGTTICGDLLDENVHGFAAASAANWYERICGMVAMTSTNGSATVFPPSIRTGAQGCMPWNSGFGGANDGNTGLANFENSANPWDWSSSHQLGWLAEHTGHPMYGENPGLVTDASPAGLTAMFNLGRQWGATGLLIVRQSTMGTTGFATLANLATEITKDVGLQGAPGGVTSSSVLPITVGPATWKNPTAPDVQVGPRISAPTTITAPFARLGGVSSDRATVNVRKNGSTLLLTGDLPLIGGAGWTAPGASGAYKAAEAAEANLVSYYTFDDASGQALDSKGSINSTTHLATLHQPSLLADATGFSISYDGTGSQFTDFGVQTTRQYAGTASFSIGVWVKPFNITSVGQCLVANFDAGVNNGWIMFLDAPTGNLVIGRFGGGTQTFFNTGVQVPVGIISHVRAMYNGSVLSAALNGLAIGGTLASAQSIVAHTGHLTVGRDSNAGDPLHATIDELAFYSAAQTVADALTMSNLGHTPALIAGSGSFGIGDDVEFLLQSVSGAPTDLQIQADGTRP